MGHEQHKDVPGEHKARAPRHARVYVITCSDSRTEANDEGGGILKTRLAEGEKAAAASAQSPQNR